MGAANGGFLEDHADLATEEAGDVAAVGQVLEIGLVDGHAAPELGVVDARPLDALRRAGDPAHQHEVAHRGDVGADRGAAAQRRPVGAQRQVELLRRVDAVRRDRKIAELGEAPGAVGAGRVGAAGGARHVVPGRPRQQVELAGVAGEHPRGVRGAAEPGRALAAGGKRARHAGKGVEWRVALLIGDHVQRLSRPLGKIGHVGTPFGEGDRWHQGAIPARRRMTGTLEAVMRWVRALRPATEAL